MIDVATTWRHGTSSRRPCHDVADSLEVCDLGVGRRWATQKGTTRRLANVRFGSILLKNSTV